MVFRKMHPKMTVFLFKIYFSCFILLRIDITQVVCTKLKLKQYSPSLLTLAVEKRLTAHERSAYGLFFTQHVKISFYQFSFTKVLALLFEVESSYQTAIT